MEEGLWGRGVGERAWGRDVEEGMGRTENEEKGTSGSM